MLEYIVLAIVPAEPAIQRTNPQVVSLVFIQAKNKIAADTSWIRLPLTVNLHLITIVAVKAVFGTDPYKSLKILCDRPDIAISKTVFLRDVIKKYRLSLQFDAGVEEYQ